MRLLLIFLFIILGNCYVSIAAEKISPADFGLSFQVDSVQQQKNAAVAMDSFLRLPAGSAPLVYRIEKERPVNNRTVDFYLVLSLCLLLGLIRYSDPHYFSILIRSFRNPSGSRHFKEQIQSATVSNFLMNIFFAVITGAYMYYLGRSFTNYLSHGFQAPLMLLWLIGGVLTIYLGKYFVIRFSGWAFNVETITEQYLFNVFLINKIIGIILLPFLIIIAFGAPALVNSMMIVSLLLVGLLIFNRYTRSWVVFGSFFQYSRFHFFTYLCASEILPMAILLKLLLHSMA